MDNTKFNVVRTKLESEKKRIQDELSQLKIGDSDLMDERAEELFRSRGKSYPIHGIGKTGVSGKPFEFAVGGG